MAGTYHIEVYGCQMNVADGELLAGLLEAHGWRPAEGIETANLILVNTCAVRERAAERAIGFTHSLARFKRSRPGTRIALVGCLARFGGRALAERLPEVDLFVGPDAYRRLPALLADAAAGPRFALETDRAETYAGLPVRPRPGVHAWISIMRGCNRMCTYCMVPFARGRERSLPAATVEERTRRLAAQGHRAITLLGQTVTAYRDGGLEFAGLLERLATVPGLARLRFLSPHPGEFTERLRAVLAATPLLGRHLHLPLQSGSNRVLAAMRRGYTREVYQALVADLRARIPGLAVTTDLIVGFPGERPEDYRETLEVMRSIRFDEAFMFAYSPRPGTYAARRLADDVPPAVKQERLQALIELQESHSRERFRARIGERDEVLIESPARAPREHWFGRATDGKDTVVVAPPEAQVRPGVRVAVRITDASSHTLQGEWVSAGAADAR